jgi:hypothetical protein
VIQRFVTTLRAAASLRPSDVSTDAGRRLLADCADAVRLELDCLQQELTPRQRDALRALSDALEDGEAPAADVVRAVREACAAVGIASAEGGAPAAPEG